MSRRKLYLYGWPVLLLGFLLLGGILLSKIPRPLFPNDYSKLVLAADGQILRVFLNGNQQWILPEEGEGGSIPPKLRAAVLHYEDKRFEKHRGIDFLALARALWQNIKKGGRISGASTITMQVARLMEPKPRTVFNKLREMAQALRIELQYSKAEILKTYLRHAPYGGNILGYRTASLRYFGREPETLSWAQVAVLAVLPNNPANINPMRNQDQLQQKRDALLVSLREAGIIDENTLNLALAEPVPQGQLPFPLAAPHLAERLAGVLEQNIIRTTIDKEIQDGVTKLVQEYITGLSRRGAKNGAVLVTETATGQVKAYVASQDYFDNSDLGKIDGVQMRRSSASTLKPFLYALAMEEGLLVRESVLLDIPTNYGGYTPYNADHRFRGVVRADQALISSLNVPAVWVLNQVGVANFLEFLKEAGLGGVSASPREYGLSAVLGSVPVSLWELSRLYRGLGQGGVFSDLQVVEQQSPPKVDLISPGTSFLLLETLKEVARPGLEYFWREYQSALPLAWKTGTSYGSCDAWAVGVSPQWTIAVWVGNFSGGEIKDLSGVDSAAPLLFQIFNRLPKDPFWSWFAKPQEDLREILVSETTGYRLKNEGGRSKTVLAPATAQPLRYSPYEKTVFLNKAGTMQVCSLCWQRDDLQVVPRLVYPPLVNAYLRLSGQDFALPPHNPNCPARRGDSPLTILYPQSNSQIFLPRDLHGEYQPVNLKAAHAFGEARLFWYLDSSYLGATEGQHEMSISLASGPHHLYVLDSFGNSTTVSFYSEKR